MVDMSAVSSPEAAQAYYESQGLPMPYRAEFNPMSGRWMVLSDKDVCQAAGMSEHKANTTVLDLIQKLNA